MFHNMVKVDNCFRRKFFEN